MKLLIRSDHPRAYGSSFEIAGVMFEVVTLDKQGYGTSPYWEYEVKLSDSGGKG